MKVDDPRDLYHNVAVSVDRAKDINKASRVPWLHGSTRSR